MGDPTEHPAWLQHEGCDQRIAELEALLHRARFVADHWRVATLKVPGSLTPHALGMVLAALDGATDPELIGINDWARDDFTAPAEGEPT